MIWAASLLTVSLLISLLNFRLEKFGYLITNILSLIVCIYGLLSAFGMAHNILPSENSAVFIFMALEVFCYYFLIRREQKLALIPYYSIPIFIISFLFFFSSFFSMNHWVLFLILSCLLELILKSNARKSNLNLGATLTTLISLIVIVLVTKFDASRITFPLLVFLYWVSKKVFPLGLAKGVEDPSYYPIVSRVVLLMLSTGKVPIDLSATQTFYFMLVCIPLIILSFFFVDKKLRAWKLIKNMNEVFLILILLLFRTEFGPEELISIIAFSVYYFIPILFGALIETYPRSQYLAFLPVLLLNGIFVGKVGAEFLTIFGEYKLGTMGVQIFTFLSGFWILNLAFSVRFKNWTITHRKNDHFHTALFASVIMTTIIISL